jgi:DNA-binding response OmpR family regulator
MIRVDFRTGETLWWNPATESVICEGVRVVVAPRCRPLAAVLFRDPGALVLREELIGLCERYRDPVETLVDWIRELRSRLGPGTIQREGSRGYRLDVADPGPFRPKVLRAGDVLYYPQRHTTGRAGVPGERSLDAIEEELLARAIRRVGRLVRWNDVVDVAGVSKRRAREAARRLQDKLGGTTSELIVAKDGIRLARGVAKVVRVDKLELAPADLEARVEGEPFPLEPDELVVLAALADRPGTTVSRNALVGALGCPEGPKLARLTDAGDVVQRFVDRLEAAVASLYEKLRHGSELIVQEDDGYLLATGEQLAVKGVLLDREARWVGCFDQEEALTPRETEFLAMLMAAHHTRYRAVESGVLLGIGPYRKHFWRLRKKLVRLCGRAAEGAAPDPDVIVFVRVISRRPRADGYELVGENLRRKRT